MKYEIDYKFVFLNNYINAERRSMYSAANIKKKATNAVHIQLIGKEKISYPCKLKYTWRLKNKRVDPDNVAFAKKYVNDGLIKAGLLPDDSMKYITGFVDEFIVHDIVGVTIEIIEEETR